MSNRSSIADGMPLRAAQQLTIVFKACLKEGAYDEMPQFSDFAGCVAIFGNC